MYEFTSTASGALFIADPPPGIQLATLLSRALSRALRSPLALPLEPLLSCAAADLPALREALLPAAATTSGEYCSSVVLACSGNVVDDLNDFQYMRARQASPTPPQANGFVWV